VTATGRALTTASILRTSTFQLTNISGSVDDIEVNIEGNFLILFLVSV
jgi:hypothetical protein